ncbi:MAG: cupin domain-containing protein [Pseudomonadota bacterium]
MTAEKEAAHRGLRPHPFEGWYKDISPNDESKTQIEWLLGAEDVVPWHQLDAAAAFTLQEGDSVVISQSSDGQTAFAKPLHQGAPPLHILPQTYLTLECVGRWSLLQLSLTPSLSVSDRRHCPDDWFPRV